MQSKKYFYLFLALICVLAGCNGKSDGKTPVTVKDSPDMNRQARDISLPGGFSSQTSLTFDSTAILAFLKKWPGFKSYENRIRKFYSARKYAYAWYDQDGLIEQAGNLYNKICNIREEGLPGNVLYENEFRQMMDDSAGTGLLRPDTNLELMITAQYFYYATNV